MLKHSLMLSTLRIMAEYDASIREASVVSEEFTLCREASGVAKVYNG